MLALRILLLTLELIRALSLLVRLAAARLATRDLNAGRHPTITAIYDKIISYENTFKI
jgi:hypothetical protein